MNGSSYEVSQPSHHVPHESVSPSYTSGLELSPIHNGLQLSPAENNHDLSSPEPLNSRDEKTGFGMKSSFFGSVNNKPENELDGFRHRRKRIFLLLGVFAVAIIMALAIALPVHFTRHHNVDRSR